MSSSTSPIVVATAALPGAVLVGWLLVIGQSLIVPILLGVISVYMIASGAQKLITVLPSPFSSPRIGVLLVLLLFLASILGLIILILENGQGITEALPVYSDNLNALIAAQATRFGFEDAPTVASLTALLQEALDFQALAQMAFGTASSIASTVVMTILYAVFLAGDLKAMPEKLQRAFSSERSAQDTTQLVLKINRRVGDYLLAKTLVNLILAALSFAVMLLLGIEFAILWAVLIGVLNYIPYIGSVVGVVFPVLICIAQFGTLGPAVTALVGLMGAQIVVGYVLEPKMLGRSVNLSAFVVLIALSFWTALWGTMGTILAVPLTAMIMIFLAEIPGARPVAVLMSEDGIL